MPEMKHPGEQLKTARLTREPFVGKFEIAVRLGIKVSRLSEIEFQRQFPTAEEVHKICEFLGVDEKPILEAIR